MYGKMILVLAATTTLVAARTVPQPEDQSTSQEATDLEPPVYSDSAENSYVVPEYLELPRINTPSIPFFAPEPSPDLRAPRLYDNPPMNYFQSPVPATNLVAPAAVAWNPSNDPKFYFEVPALLTGQQKPTATLPKKYDKDLHSKNKPYSNLPKQEILLVPISEAEYQQKEKELYKTYDKQAKIENKKDIEEEQAKKEEPDAAASNFKTKGVDSKKESTDQDFAQGLSTELVASLGIPTSHSHGGSGERLSFHLNGHDGPNSYKWGYDTGKGHNRLFRYEERDKHGVVKGHYGFYDDHGKLQMISYDSHPHEGFHASSDIK